ncbi:MAG: prepilin-type N-terminal cleavage/methylation domain-containing protein [Deltaproteobacteria bacterium]|nr:prepilin-type N-terminal cleavage/methylation domain-containing protein [Deltaproteobacteria bacterium]
MKRLFRGFSPGFTLIEIMISLSILSIALLSIYAAQGNSLRASGRAENIQTASMLARQKMTEKMIELQKDMDKGKFPDDQINDQGEFEPPFDRFRWEFAVRKVEIPVVENPSDTTGQATGEGPATSTGKEPGAANQAPEAAQANLAKMVTKKISESVREITTKIIWQEMEEDQNIVITTHISKLQ